MPLALTGARVFDGAHILEGRAVVIGNGSSNVLKGQIGIASFLGHAVEERFLRVEHLEVLMVESEAGPLVERLREFEPDSLLPKWIDHEET